MITQHQLNHRLHQSIGEICPNGFITKKDQSHCAHYVSHVLGFAFGTTCAQMVSGTKPGATLRVVDLFAKCPQVGHWTTHPTTRACLIFLTVGHVDLYHKWMAHVGKKHVGIYLAGQVWHYSNGTNQVVKQRPDQFLHHFPGHHASLYYGLFPGTA